MDLDVSGRFCLAENSASGAMFNRTAQKSQMFSENASSERGVKQQTTNNKQQTTKQ